MGRHRLWHLAQHFLRHHAFNREADPLQRY